MPSSAIRDFTYDPVNRELTVTFVTGRRYVYFAVPADVAEGFRDASSKGSYFNEAIRDVFTFERLRRSR